MNSHPLVSVIIPTFNRDKATLNAIRSVGSQSFQDFELIVIDDGSTDNTKELVSSLSNPKVRYFYQENQGLPVAWNSGIEKSTGKYIAFLDSDDTWLRDKLKFQVDFLENAHPKYPGCATGYFIHAINGRRIPVIPKPAHACLKGILWKNILHLGTTFVCRRDVFREIGLFDPNLQRSQDTDWLIRYRKKKELGIIPETLAVFNQHLTRSGTIMEQSLLYLLEKHKTDMLEFGPAFYRRKAAIIYRDLAFQFSRENNLVKARNYSKKAFLTYPMISPGLFLVLIDVHLGTQLKRKADSIKYPGAFK